VNSQEAKRVLATCRPGSRDEENPKVREALEHARARTAEERRPCLDIYSCARRSDANHERDLAVRALSQSKSAGSSTGMAIGK